MPPGRPVTLSEEIRGKRLARKVDRVGDKVYDHVIEYVCSRCDADDTIDTVALETDLWRYFMSTTPRYDGSGDGDKDDDDC